MATPLFAGKRVSVAAWLKQLAIAVVATVSSAPGPRCDYQHAEEDGKGGVKLYEPCGGRLRRMPTPADEPLRWACRQCGRAYQQIGRTQSLEAAAS